MGIKISSILLGFVLLSVPVIVGTIAFHSFEGVNAGNMPNGYLNPYILASVLLSSGYFCVGLLSKKWLVRSIYTKLALSFMLAIPISASIYLAINTDDIYILFACLAVISYTIIILKISIWPTSNKYPPGNYKR